MRLIPGLASILLISSASGVIIDDFRSGAVWVEGSSIPGATEVQTQLDPAHVIGGTRSVYVGSAGGTTYVQIDPFSGSLTLSGAVSNSSTDRSYFRLDYGTASPLDLNLLAAGDSAMVLQFD